MSVNRIRGDMGVVIDSESFLELPKAPTKITPDAIRSGMIRYNKEWAAFEGVLDFTDGTVEYRRFANLDQNGKLLTSQLPDSITSGLQFMGTWDSLEDDINPPNTYSPLPSPDPSMNGDYFVSRGTMDLAQAHYTLNKSPTSPVLFTPVNPTGEGNWIEILYYIDQNPIDKTKMIVSYAFARIDTTQIPATGHEGLMNLAQDPQLTNPFDTTLSPQNQTALSDGDWIIINDTKNIRLRQSRASINSSSVLYDGTILKASNRPYSTSAGTVQTTLDNLGLEALRRTGDSMVDDGRGGEGRFAIRYGDATKPSMTFNDADFDPVNNPGTDPTKWTDNNTGIFHPTNKAIGFSTDGVERLRITNNTLNIYQTTTATPATNPTIRLEGTGNVNVGITALNNVFTFSSVGKAQVEFADSISSFHGDVTIDGNLITKGTSTLQGSVQMNSTLTVNSTFNLKGSGTIGTNNTNTLLVNSNTTFAGSTTFNGTNRFKNLNMMPEGVVTFESSTNQSTLTLTSTDLELDMGNFADVTIKDGSNTRLKINRYGLLIPVLTTVDDNVGEDGMIAYSPTQSSSMQKVDGHWVPIGTGKVITNDFLITDWVLNGDYYTLTVNLNFIVNADIHEDIGAAYSKVEIDSIVMTDTSVVYSIPAVPDVRFNGRTVVTVSK